MAMTPPAASDPSEMDDGQAASPDDQDQGASAGYCIEIHVSAGGAITVEVEPEGEEAQEEAGGAAGEPGEGGGAPEGAPAKNIKDALTMALEIYRNNGQSPEAADDSFQQGFDGSGQ